MSCNLGDFMGHRRGQGWCQHSHKSASFFSARSIGPEQRLQDESESGPKQQPDVAPDHLLYIDIYIKYFLIL